MRKQQNALMFALIVSLPEHETNQGTPGKRVAEKASNVIQANLFTSANLKIDVKSLWRLAGV